jgi:DNA uptake protein ComE-like DNA-binding protein
MKIFKSHFWYNKSQRNGIFFLIFLILLFQVFISSDIFSSDEIIDIHKPEILAFQAQIDSLKADEVYNRKNRKPKIYPFNPNYITDYKGEQLGMSLAEIDRLLAFRKTNKFINSKNEFKQVTKVSDSLLNIIAPYFKFPDWVVNRNHEKSSLSLQKTKQSVYKNNVISSVVERSTIDINKATAADFKTISGIGVSFSERIIQYRSKLQGFSFENQLYEVWGLDKKVADKVLSTFKIIDKPIIKKQNVNTLTFKELLKNPYIEYELCKRIFDYREEVAELQDISELKIIKDFPLDKYDRIVLYLFAK